MVAIGTGSEDKIILICRVISQDHVIKNDVIYWKETIKVGHYSVTFGGHRDSDSGDIVILVYHVILQDHVIKGSSAFTDRSLSSLVIILPNLVVIGTVIVKIQ